MKKIKSVLKYAFVILGIILIDLVTKGTLLYLITGHVPLYGAAWSVVPYPYLMAHLTDFFNIVFTWNPGTAFSLFRALGEFAPIVIVIITAFITGFIMYYLFTRARGWERMPLALIAGGAIGNLLDRVRFGAVIDFLSFHTPGCMHWYCSFPAFNFADICISVGVGLYILMWLIQYRREKIKK